MQLYTSAVVSTPLQTHSDVIIMLIVTNILAYFNAFTLISDVFTINPEAKTFKTTHRVSKTVQCIWY